MTALSAGLWQSALHFLPYLQNDAKQVEINNKEDYNYVSMG